MRKNIFLLSLVSIMLVSCNEDFLDQTPRSALTVGTFPVSESDAILATNAVYNGLRAWHINTGGFPILDIMADDASKGSNPGDGAQLNDYETFKHNASEGSMERWYKTLYEVIRRSNLVVNEVPKINNMDENLKQRLIGEARFLRAYYYSLLVRGFGDVPKVLVIDPPLDLTRAPYTEILNEIIYPDLEFAVSVLPEKSAYAANDLGRATKGAARGLLARIKLFYGDFPAVEKLCEDIINSGEYTLMSDYKDVFSANFEHNSESVFEVSAIPDSYVNGGNQYANTQTVRGTPNRGWGFGRPTYSFISEMQNNNDLRLEPTVLFVNEVIDGVLIVGDSPTLDTTYVNGVIVEVECYNQKVWYPGPDPNTSFGHNRRIIRYADILMMYAEALNENGKSSQALPYLNLIRNRAGLSDVTTTDKNQLRDIIILERKYEFGLEGLRFWDLVRTGKAEAVLGPLGFIKGKNELLPIPQSEVDISQGRIKQNFGY